MKTTKFYFSVNTEGVIHRYETIDLGNGNYFTIFTWTHGEDAYAVRGETSEGYSGLALTETPEARERHLQTANFLIGSQGQALGFGVNCRWAHDKGVQIRGNITNTEDGAVGTLWTNMDITIGDFSKDGPRDVHQNVAVSMHKGPLVQYLLVDPDVEMEKPQLNDAQCEAMWKVLLQIFLRDQAEAIR